MSESLSLPMWAALDIAQRDGVVVAGTSTHNGRVERVSANSIEALISRGLLTRAHGSDGCIAGRIVARLAKVAP